MAASSFGFDTVIQPNHWTAQKRLMQIIQHCRRRRKKKEKKEKYHMPWKLLKPVS